MPLTRREMLAACAAAAPAIVAPIASVFSGDEKKASAKADQPKRMGVGIHSYAIRAFGDSSGDRKTRRHDPLAFFDHCHKLGAGGAQIELGGLDESAAKRLAETAAARRMFVEGSIRLPRDRADVDRFDAEVRASKAAGASVLRTVMLSGRRYEQFDSADAFRRFAEQSWQSLMLAEPVVARHAVRLAVENHKDWRVDQLLAMLKRVDSRHVGVCVDLGNSIALLEDPLEVVKAYAPWTVTVHVKDMAVAEYEQGFLLSEVPLGQGLLDLKQMIRILRDARPEVQFNLEMLTRDPLKVPCLTDKYMATFADVPARDLARTLALVRRCASKTPLPRVSQLSRDERLKAEDENVRLSLAYAREHLGL